MTSQVVHIARQLTGRICPALSPSRGQGTKQAYVQLGLKGLSVLNPILKAVSSFSETFSSSEAVTSGSHVVDFPLHGRTGFW